MFVFNRLQEEEEEETSISQFPAPGESLGVGRIPRSSQIIWEVILDVTAAVF
jgi:hypothetical protein